MGLDANYPAVTMNDPNGHVTVYNQDHEPIGHLGRAGGSGENRFLGEPGGLRRAYPAGAQDAPRRDAFDLGRLNAQAEAEGGAE
jgi:hypothetical protein